MPYRAFNRDFINEQRNLKLWDIIAMIVNFIILINPYIYMLCHNCFINFSCYVINFILVDRNKYRKGKKKELGSTQLFKNKGCFIEVPPAVTFAVQL